MNNLVIYSKMTTLPESLQSELAAFVDSLVQKAKEGKTQHKLPKPVFGSARGHFRMHADFDEPLPDFDEYTNP